MLDFDALFSAEGLVSLVSLTVMEIVLGIDNVLLVAILSQKVKPAHQKRVRQLGIGLALVLRIVLLFALTWLMGLTKTLFTVLGNEMSGRDLVLLVGGLFLIYKATHELYERIERSPTRTTRAAPTASRRTRWRPCSRSSPSISCSRSIR